MTSTDHDTPDASAGKQSDNPTDAPVEPIDVAVIGGGPAGLSAGVFLARAGLETMIFEHGKSTLQKCAHLENYLGFPAGIRPNTFLDIARDHAETAGCGIVRSEVTAVRQPEPDGFILECAEGFPGDSSRTDGVGTLRVQFLLVVSWSDTEFLAPLGVDTHEEAGHDDIQVVDVDHDGRTNIEGLYAAGRVTDQHHQAIVNAGHGAHVALTLIEDIQPQFYNDWVVPEGYFARYDRETPVGCEEISHEERRERVRRSRETMRTYFSDHGASGD